MTEPEKLIDAALEYDEYYCIHDWPNPLTGEHRFFIVCERIPRLKPPSSGRKVSDG